MAAAATANIESHWIVDIRMACKPARAMGVAGRAITLSDHITIAAGPTATMAMATKTLTSKRFARDLFEAMTKGSDGTVVTGAAMAVTTTAAGFHGDLREISLALLGNDRGEQ